MTELVLTDAFVSIDGNDVSDHVRSVALNYGAEMVENTPMSLATRRRLGGLLDWSVEVTFNQDFAASDIDSIMFPLVGTTFTVIVRPVASSAVGATNPNYSGTGILESYNPMGGGVGDNAETPITIQAAGTLSRLVA